MAQRMKALISSVPINEISFIFGKHPGVDATSTIRSAPASEDGFAEQDATREL